ncbi:hypothetical protein DY000_02009767 [Brassica cretica]|uniref:F-box domain-containing protein n=1 Tax=Brassica cretica TaxID=69181 RepID=A0ABQ7C1V7_BRACR|nr:hypothetical protein DY000_02009767 [Brassica cretica]
MENMEQQFSEGQLLSTSGHETQSLNSVRQYSSDQIPVDLLMEIFSLVPLKSIARFHCLSKFLASILRRHDFTELFLTKSLTRPRFLFTVKSKGKLFLYSSPQPHNPDNNSSLVATSYHPTLVPDYHPTYISKHVGQKLVLWYLEDAGNHKWSKHSYVLSPLEENILKITKFVGMTSTGEFVYSWSWNSSVWFYNTEKNTVKRVDIQGTENPRIINTFVDYVENMKFI